MSELCISVSVAGLTAHANLDSLEERYGPLADGSGDMEVYAGAGVPGLAESRSFSVGPELTAAAARGGYLAPGVSFAVTENSPADYELRGPGAGITATMRGVPGIRQRAFPRMPQRWQDAIRQAAGR